MTSITNKILIVVDMQNDFVYGPLGTKEARSIVPNVIKKIQDFRVEAAENQDNDKEFLIVFTFDTHNDNYLNTQEGMKLPIKHCMYGTDGHKLVNGITVDKRSDISICKTTFGEINIGAYLPTFSSIYDNVEIEMIGICTDICVVSNALILKATCPKARITVDASCCAGTTPELHEAALKVMQSCQIDVINWK